MPEDSAGGGPAEQEAEELLRAVGAAGRTRAHTAECG